MDDGAGPFLDPIPSDDPDLQRLVEELAHVRQLGEVAAGLRALSEDAEADHAMGLSQDFERTILLLERHLEAVRAGAATADGRREVIELADGLGTSATDRALKHMLYAAHVLIGHGHGDANYHAWHRTAVDYWMLVHPELGRFGPGDPSATPTTIEMRERAEVLAHAMDGIPRTWRLAPPSHEWAEHLARVAWARELMTGLYRPIRYALDRARYGDRSGVETLVRFLEADVYCHRSGYHKADAIRILTRISLDDASVDRLRGVVLAAVEGPDRREFRSYIRLARRVDSAELRRALASRAESDDQRTSRHAHWVQVGLGVGKPDLTQARTRSRRTLGPGSPRAAPPR